MKIIHFIFFYTVLICNVQKINACTCRFPSLEEKYFNSNIIFVGKVLSIDTIVNYSEIKRNVKTKNNLDSSFTYNYTFEYNKIRLLVYEKFKGTYKSDTVEMTTSTSMISCGFPFKIDKKYIIFSESESIHLCSGTKQFYDSLVLELKELIKVCQKDRIEVISNGDYEKGKQFALINQNNDTIANFGEYKTAYFKGFHSFGIIETHEGKFIGIDLKGKHLFEVLDFGFIDWKYPDVFENDLIRIIKDSKIGYADRKGNIVIPPTFACASRFNYGKAKVSFSCSTYLDTNKQKWEADEYFFINTKGEIVKE